MYGMLMRNNKDNSGKEESWHKISSAHAPTAFLINEEIVNIMCIE